MNPTGLPMKQSWLNVLCCQPLAAFPEMCENTSADGKSSQQSESLGFRLEMLLLQTRIEVPQLVMKHGTYSI